MGKNKGNIFLKNEHFSKEDKCAEESGNVHKSAASTTNKISSWTIKGAVQKKAKQLQEQNAQVRREKGRKEGKRERQGMTMKKQRCLCSYWISIRHSEVQYFDNL